MRGGEYLEFVANRVRKIKEHKVDACCLLPTIQLILEVEVARLKTQNCGGKVRNGCLIVISGHLILRPKKVPNSSRSQIKVIREVVVVATVPEADEFDDLLAKYDLKRALRVCVWISRFVCSCRGAKRVGPITIEEMREQTVWWIRRANELSCLINTPTSNYN